MMRPTLVVPATLPRDIEIILLNKDGPIKITLDEKEQTVEDVCSYVAKKLKIGPLCRHLFSLQIKDTGLWLYPNYVLQNSDATSFVFRIRFKVPSIRRLKEADLHAFEYYFHQVRKDVLSNTVKGLDYGNTDIKGTILGLSVTDMYRATIEEKKTVEQLEHEYKKYIPKIVLKSHLFFVKQKVFEPLNKIMTGRHDDTALYVKEQYLSHFYTTATKYLLEDFEAQVDEGGSIRIVSISVDPFSEEQSGILVRYGGKEEWQHLCSIEDLCFISIRADGTVEICRRNGIPIYFRFITTAIMNSFVSLLDGYYRFMSKWTFNLCREIFAPSLVKLYTLKCHGPVGGQFSYSKLLEKRENKQGTFILRQSENSDDIFFLDVCVANSSRPKTYKITRGPLNDFTFGFDNKVYTSLSNLVAAYKTDDGSGLVLSECIPPSEYDKSLLLICSKESWVEELGTVTNPEDFLLTAPPQCINLKTLQVFPGSKRESRSGKTLHYRAIWKHAKHSRVKVAMKELKPEFCDKLLSEFLELGGRWACLQSNMIVKLYGVTLTGKITMITEYLDMGPLDLYLQNNQHQIKQVDLVEAGSSLAMALWQMEEAGITHGYIRCRKLLVSAHEANALRVKLADPGLHKLNDSDVPWMPPECHSNPGSTKLFTTADIWAFGTTLWEIFSMGKQPTRYEKAFYQCGGHLPQPVGCPSELYRLMLECWDLDLFRRKRPQAIMRDIYHILYQVFNSRRTHSYATAYPQAFPTDDNSSLAESGHSLHSDATDETTLITDVPTDELIPVDLSAGNMSDISMSSDSGHIIIFKEDGPYSTQVNVDHATLPLALRSRNNDFSAGTIFQIGKDCNVVRQGRIGVGFYGEVFLGLLERPDREPQKVAIKELKVSALLNGSQGDQDNAIKDQEREIEIMKHLDHPNIVRIIGAIRERELSLVMEHVPEGNLKWYLSYHKHSHILGTAVLLKFAEDVAKGMEYLGSRKIVHRDLAARNILVAGTNHVKISDFGLAQFVDTNNDDYYMFSTSRNLPIKWHAPESLKENKFSLRSDVWSYGVTLYEMFSLGEDPKLDESDDEMDQRQLYEALCRGIRLPCPSGEGVQLIYQDIMDPCWKFDSRHRPSFTKLIVDIDKLRTKLGISQGCL